MSATDGHRRTKAGRWNHPAVLEYKARVRAHTQALLRDEPSWAPYVDAATVSADEECARIDEPMAWAKAYTDALMRHTRRHLHQALLDDLRVKGSQSEREGAEAVAALFPDDPEAAIEAYKARLAERLEEKRTMLAALDRTIAALETP